MRLYLDIHDTVAELHPKWIYHYESRFGRKVLPQELRRYEREPYRDWLSILQTPGFLADLPLVRDAQAVIRELTRDHEVYLVSSPPAWTAASDVYQWAHTNFRVPGILGMDRLVLTRSKFLLDCSDAVMVDDNPAHLELFVGSIIVFDRPWNQGYKFASRRDAGRIATWPALLEML